MTSGKDLVTTSPAAAALAHADLVRRAAEYAQSGKAENTRKAYAAGWRAFLAFCEAHGAPALPATSATVAAFLTDLATSGKSVSTVNSYLTAVKFEHAQAGQINPCDHPLVAQIMAGIRRQHGRPPAKKDAVDLDELRALVQALPPTLAGQRDKALMLVGWAGAFRRSELTALDRSDLRITDVLKITLRKSKTDQTGQGKVKVICRLADRDLCPVVALEAWLSAAGITSGPIWRRVDRNGKALESRLTPQSVALILKRAGAQIGADTSALAGHSLRRGFITAAVMQGADPLDIAAQTGHKTLDTLRAYVADAGAQQVRAVKAAFED